MRQRLDRLDRRGRRASTGALRAASTQRLDFGRAMNAALREAERRRGPASAARLLPRRRASSRPRARGSPSRASASVAPKLVARLGPAEASGSTCSTPPGWSSTARRKNSLVGHGRPRLAYDTPGEAFGADGAVALYRREALDDCAVDGAGVRRGPRRDGRPTPTWPGAARLLGWRCAYEPAGASPTTSAAYSPSTRARHARGGPPRCSSATAT